jgi:hypothetical protein
MPELALRYIKDSISFLCSFVTKERIKTELVNKKIAKRDIYFMTVRIQQRKLQIKLMLRESVLLSEMKRHSESLDVAKDAVSESISLIFDTLKLCYILVLKMQSLKLIKINKIFKSNNKFYFSSKDYDNLMQEDEHNINSRLNRQKMDE